MAVGKLLLELTGEAVLKVNLKFKRYHQSLKKKRRDSNVATGEEPKLTVAGPCESLEGMGRGQRWRLPFCRGQPQSVIDQSQHASSMRVMVRNPSDSTADTKC